MSCPFALSNPFATMPVSHTPFTQRRSSSRPPAISSPGAVYIPPLASSSSSLIALQDSKSVSLPDLPSGPQPTRLSERHVLLPATLALHKALFNFRALTGEYAVEEYHEAFNWDQLDLGVETDGTWYCVAFRSKRMPGTEHDLSLYEADKAAHEEALDNGGLLLYWYGLPTADGMNLATCIWESRMHAKLANSQPHHLAAVRLTARSYEYYTLERYTLRKIRGEKEVRVEPYVLEEEEEMVGKGAGSLRSVRSNPTCPAR